MAKHVSLSPRALSCTVPHEPGSFSPRSALSSFGVPPSSLSTRGQPFAEAFVRSDGGRDEPPTANFAARSKKPEASRLHADRCPGAPAGNPMRASFPCQRPLRLAYARALLGFLSRTSVTTRTPKSADGGHLFHATPLRLVEESAIEVGHLEAFGNTVRHRGQSSEQSNAASPALVGVGRLISRRRFWASMS